MQYCVLNIFLYFFFTFDLGLTEAMKFCLFLNLSNDKRGFETAEGFGPSFEKMNHKVSPLVQLLSFPPKKKEKGQNRRWHKEFPEIYRMDNGYGQFYVLNNLQ